MTAAAPQLIPVRDPETEQPPQEVRRPHSGYQPPLFHEMLRVMPAPEFAKPVAPARKRAARPARRVDDNQQALEFIESPVPRTLPTSVESPIYCDARAASPLHRFTAACIDFALVAAAVGLFAAAFRFIAGPIPMDIHMLQAGIGVTGVLYLMYQALFSIAGTETTGCVAMGLRLVDFDGKRPTRKTRLQRFAFSIISMGAVLGVVWALFEEERLTWHDLISKTFPTADAD